MMKLLYLYALIFLSVSLVAQAPQAFSYQAIVTTEGGEVIQEQAVGVQVDILDGDINGPIVYRETHNITTNMNGIYTLNIGEGSQVQGSFSDIKWGSGSKYLSISQDVTGGSDYQFVGTSQLLSVPYAIYADQVEPLIYVQEGLDNPRNLLDLSESDPSFIISVVYQWIQGIPEDVFVEYNNLPDNTHLRLVGELGRFGVEDRENFTAVDTIFDGIRVRTNELVRSDTGVDPIPGEYTIDIVYRTAERILGTVTYPFTISRGTPPDPTSNCIAGSTGEVYTLVSPEECESLESLIISNEIMFEAQGDEFLFVDLFDMVDPFEIFFFDDGERCVYDVRGNFDFEDGNFIYEGIRIEMTVEDDEVIFEIMAIRFVQGSDDSEDINCTLRYRR